MGSVKFENLLNASRELACKGREATTGLKFSFIELRSNSGLSVHRRLCNLDTNRENHRT